ncbi:hypothetical protein C8Q77DRAFT_295694 [Trametes polyzona]|nr:hypothetical protein C8Q77DRAFT_295694 [Trametes polyzona]
MSDLSWNIWGAVSAAIGLLCPSLWTWIKSHFLPAKLEALEKLTMEVAKLLTLARRHGLLVDDGEYCLFNSKLWHAQERLDKAGAMVAAHPGVINNLKGLWSDLSRQVSLMIDDINSVKVQLLLRTSKERKKLASSGNIADIPDYADFEGELKHTSNFPVHRHRLPTCHDCASTHSGFYLSSREHDEPFPRRRDVLESSGFVTPSSSTSASVRR